jgi:hypothetical protein
MATAVYAAPPPDGPPGLERAIEVKEKHEKAILEVRGVAGVAVGHNGNATPSVLILMETPGVRGLPSSLEGVPVVQIVSGKIVALPKPPGTPGGKPPKDEEPPVNPTVRFERPVPTGVSTGHPDITAGTIGARVVDGFGNVYALSNNHVYANENLAVPGDDVMQPGAFDGGALPADYIGTLSDFEPIVFSESASNVIDAAIASSTTALLDNSTPSDGYGIPKSTTAEPDINMKVKKYGRTTGLTKGQIFATNATVNVGYSSGTARFVNQIIITPGDFSAGGDSGSLIVVDGKGRNRTDNNKPVGLLFAGSSLVTIANPIDAILNEFGVTIDGE